MNLLRYYVVSFCAMLVLAGCGGSSSSTTTPPPPPTVGKLYVTSGSTDSVLRFAAGATGNVSPQIKVTTPVIAPMELPWILPACNSRTQAKPLWRTGLDQDGVSHELSALHPAAVVFLDENIPRNPTYFPAFNASWYHTSSARFISFIATASL